MLNDVLMIGWLALLNGEGEEENVEEAIEGATVRFRSDVFMIWWLGLEWERENGLVVGCWGVERWTLTVGCW